MPRLACWSCGRQIYTVSPIESLFAEERRCPRCGAGLRDERRTADRREIIRRASPGTPAPEGEEPVTIVFKDGRQPEQIHNYILTRSTLFVGDKQRREIPTEQLDLAATAKANQDAGIDFRLPGTPR